MGIAAASHGDDEAPGDDDVEGIRRLALAHQHVAALEVQRLELGRRARAAFVCARDREDLDPVEAGLALRFLWTGFRWLLARRFPCCERLEPHFSPA